MCRDVLDFTRSPETFALKKAQRTGDTLDLFSSFIIKNSDILFFLVGKHFAKHTMIKREVKMAGHRLSSLFAFLWTATKSRSVKSQKKQGQSPAILTEQTW